MGATLWQANDDRVDRALGQQARTDPYEDRFRAYQTDTPYRGDVWTTIYMGGLTVDASTPEVKPPGVPRFLEPGATYVSPAVRKAISHDPLASARVPGTVVGTIGEEGLQSPDQLLVYAGRAPGPAWWRADGWGSTDVAVARATIPRGPLLLLIGVLVVLPAILLARATGLMSATSRQRSIAACHLLGVPAQSLATAAAVDAFLCAVLGAGIGIAVTALTVAGVHRTGLLGLQWFPPPTMVPPLISVAVVAVFSALITHDAVRLTRSSLRTPLPARAGAPRTTRWWSLVPLALGIASVAGALVSYVAFGPVIGNARAIGCLFVGTGLSVWGALSGMPLLLDLWSRRLRRRPCGSTAFFVSARRLSWQRDSIAASCIAISIVGMASLVGSGAVADLGGITADRAGAETWAVGVPLDRDVADVLAIPGTPRLLLVHSPDGEDLTFADCSTLATFVGADSRTASRRLTRQCRPDSTFRVASGGSSAPGRIVLPGYDGQLAETPIVATDPTYARLPDGQRSILALAGRTDAQVDDYVSRVMATAPEADVSSLTADSFAPMVTPTRRLLVACATAGLLTSAALLVLSTLDQRRRSRVDDARLIALGASPRFVARVHAITVGRGALLALASGLLIGLLAGTLYDRIGGLVGGPGHWGLLLALLAALVAAGAVLLTWVASLAEHRAPLSEELRRE